MVEEASRFILSQPSKLRSVERPRSIIFELIKNLGKVHIIFLYVMSFTVEEPKLPHHLTKNRKIMAESFIDEIFF